MRTGCPDLDISNANLMDLDLCDMAHDVQKPTPVEKREKPAEEPPKKEEKKEEVKKEEGQPKEFMGMDANTAIMVSVLAIALVTVVTVYSLKKITSIKPITITP